MTYEPLQDCEGTSLPPQTRLARFTASLASMRDTGARFLGRLLTFCLDYFGEIVGFLLIGAFVCLWAYIFFGNIWAFLTYDAAGEAKKAEAALAARNAALIKPIMDKLAELERDIGLLQQAVDKLDGRRHEP
ncbi:unnamed protein product [Cutaneotrichosporon oleaginosum]